VIISICFAALGIRPVDTREASVRVASPVSIDGDVEVVHRERFHWKLPFEEYEATDFDYR
jgi:hypothetical protein